jgi:hypothetical protein
MNEITLSHGLFDRIKKNKLCNVNFSCIDYRVIYEELLCELKIYYILDSSSATNIALWGEPEFEI